MGLRGCKNPPNETWYCYDTSGRPVGGALILYDYGLPSYAHTGKYFRFANVSGKVVLDVDNDELGQGLSRGNKSLYSRQLKNGGVGLGVRWHEGQPIPKVPVYFDEWNNKIYIAPNDDPQVCHAALDLLMTCSSQTADPAGDPKPAIELNTFAAREREDFLQKYGETIVPPEYLESIRIKFYHK